MPRKGPAYPITPDWQNWVRSRLQELDWIPADLHRESGVSKASITEMLKEGAVQTTVMPQIHKALGWPPPLRCPPLHVLALVDAFLKLSDLDQGVELERLRGRIEAAKAARSRRNE